MKSSNPVYTRMAKEQVQVDSYNIATYRGVGLKTLLFIALSIAGAFGAVALASSQSESAMQRLVILIIVSSVVTLIAGLVATLVPRLSAIFGSIYCVAQGFLLGFVSLIFENQFPGIVLAAALGTMSIVLIVSVLYITNLIKVTNTFVRMVMIYALGLVFSVLMLYLVSLFVPTIANLFASSFWLIVGIEALFLLLACFYLFLDLRAIETIVSAEAPKQSEWYVAFGLVFTILWIYLRVLRILAIILSRRND